MSRANTSQDRYFGYRELANFCQFVISDLFDVKEIAPKSGLETPPQSPSTQKKCPDLLDFIAYALYRTCLPVPITHQALILLQRLKSRYPSARGTASSPHRLFLSSLMLSSKISMDDTFSNKSWAIVGGNNFTLREINQMERELFAFLDFTVVVSKEQLSTFVCEQQLKWHLSKQRPTHAAPITPPLSPEHDPRKRRRSDSLASDCALRAEEDTRHQRAADAVIALLQPDGAQRAKLIASCNKNASLWTSRMHQPTCSSQSSPSLPASGTSSSTSSMSSSAASSPASKSPTSPLSSTGPGTPPDLHETCDRFAKFCHTSNQKQKPNPFPSTFTPSDDVRWAT